jgi:cell division transport system ATP-binding protein
LDPELSIDVMNIFRRFNEVGVTVLIASHDLYLLEHFPVRRVRLEGGRIVDAAEVSSADEPLDAPLLDPATLLDREEGEPT